MYKIRVYRLYVYINSVINVIHALFLHVGVLGVFLFCLVCDYNNQILAVLFFSISFSLRSLSDINCEKSMLICHELAFKKSSLFVTLLLSNYSTIILCRSDSDTLLSFIIEKKEENNWSITSTPQSS